MALKLEEQRIPLIYWYPHSAVKKGGSGSSLSTDSKSVFPSLVNNNCSSMMYINMSSYLWEMG